MNDREQRGLALAALFKIEQTPEGKWVVPSQKGDGRTYTVDPQTRHCDCPDHRDRGVKCKHMFAVEFVQTRECKPDGTETVTRTIKLTEKVTYKQDWPAYNKAQSQEKRLFLSILADLSRGVDILRYKRKGRCPLPLSETTFACVYKVYTGMSARRFNTDLEEAARMGYFKDAPHFNVAIKHMDDPELTAILKLLIVESSRPLAAVETAFAVDSSGFSTCRFLRWFDYKYGKTMEEREWVKAHIVCGVKTNIITAAEILERDSADSPQLPGLVDTTARRFTIKEVSADAVYSSQANMEAVVKHGATPYIAFRDNTTGAAGGLFAKMFHYFCANKDEFLKHYHLRSNVESTFNMVKAKFGDSVKSRTDAAMKNEALAKLLCHNICCLIHSMFELGIEAKFWDEADLAEKEVKAKTEPELETVPAQNDLESWAWI